MINLHICIPAYAEKNWLPDTLTSLQEQDDQDFSVWVCVNHAQEDITNAAKSDVVANNSETLDWIKRQSFPFPLQVIDATHHDSAPPAKKAGVGWARGQLFDHAFAAGASHGLSLDADSLVPRNYVSEIKAAFRKHQNALGIVSPYIHPVDLQAPNARQALRYEIYMRYYQICLWLIRSPYAFLPLGSAMAFTHEGYRLARGFASRQAGEDFYFLQNLRKAGPLVRWLPTQVRPASRASLRVPFGTGKAISMEMPELCKQFPLYSWTYFQTLSDCFEAFSQLYKQDCTLPWGSFVERLGGYSAFSRMRRNSKDESHFRRLCHQKFDALKTLQYLRWRRANDTQIESDEVNLRQLSGRLGSDLPHCQLADGCLEDLDKMRQALVTHESIMQQSFMNKWSYTTNW